MRILLLTPFLPDPEAPHGGGSYLGSLAEGLRTRAELGLVHLHHLGEPTAPAAIDVAPMSCADGHTRQVSCQRAESSAESGAESGAASRAWVPALGEQRRVRTQGRTWSP